MINIIGPTTLVLTPNTLATVLDALASFGPWRVVDVAIKEITGQLKEANEHTPGRSESTTVGNGGDHSISPSSDSGLGSNDSSDQAQRPN